MDTGRVAQALRFPGIDPRHWVSYGTVCTVSSNGDANFTDQSAVFVAPEGCTVDVLLMPANQHVPVRYTGVQGGAAGTIYTPIKPGDEVLVVIPDGDLRLPPVIACILSGEHSPLPLGDDRKPVWKNDRLLINGANVPVEVRSSGQPVTVHTTGDAGVEVSTDAVKLKVNSDGTIQLGEHAAEQLVKGTTYRGQEALMNQELIAAMALPVSGLAITAAAITPGDLAAITGLAPTVGAFIASCKVFFPLWLSALQAFEAQAAAYLSTVSSTE